MLIKLRVAHEADGDDRAPSEYLFDQPEVTLGRGPDNDVTLNDPKRIVSSRHAAIRRVGSTCQLVDLGSKNFTYLEGQRLQADDPRPLSDGDRFEIGEFQITFSAVTQAPSDASGEETVFAGDFSNPFADPVEELRDALSAIAEAYDREAPQRREDALEEAVRGAGDIHTSEATRRIFELLGLSAPQAPTGPAAPEKQSPPSAGPPPSPDAGPTAAPTDPGTSEAAPSRSASSQASPSQATPSQAAPSQADSPQGAPSRSAPSQPTPSQPVQAGDAVTDAVIDTLVAAVSRTVGIPWQFRHEFIGQTIMQSAETQFLYDGTVESMKAHLMDPSLSAEERRRRLQHVTDAADALVTHQVAMLNGYKASVMQGAETLLDQIDPDAIREVVHEENPLFQYLSFLDAPAVLQRLETVVRELKSGDWSSAEQRSFRPAFIKAYLARMTAVDPTPSQDRR
jgi:predicted component of type VI protein secretion system